VLLRLVVKSPASVFLQLSLCSVFSSSSSSWSVSFSFGLTRLLMPLHINTLYNTQTNESDSDSDSIPSLETASADSADSLPDLVDQTNLIVYAHSHAVHHSNVHPNYVALYADDLIVHLSPISRNQSPLILPDSIITNPTVSITHFFVPNSDFFGAITIPSISPEAFFSELDQRLRSLDQSFQIIFEYPGWVQFTTTVDIDPLRTLAIIDTRYRVLRPHKKYITWTDFEFIYHQRPATSPSIATVRTHIYRHFRSLFPQARVAPFTPQDLAQSRLPANGSIIFRPPLHHEPSSEQLCPWTY